MWAHGTRCFQKIATLLGNYFYEGNSLLRGLHYIFRQMRL